MRENRLLDAASFSRVFGKAKRSKDRLFTVLYRSNGGKPARLGLAVSKKNCRLATQRNRLKRQIRESFREHKQALTGRDIVVLNQRTTHTVSNRELMESLNNHWNRVSGNG